MQESAYSGDLKWKVKAAVLMAAVFVVDQLSKRFAFASDRFADAEIVPGLLGFMHHQNYGIVANIPIPQFIIIVSTVLILLFVFRLLYRSMVSGASLKVIAFSLIAAGALGNLFDRLLFGYVRDWILLFDRSVINIADIAICVGILMLFLKEVGSRK